MWKEGFETGPRNGPQNQDQRDPNLNGLFAVAFATAVAMFFASLLPAPLFAPAMRELLHFGALGALSVAVVRRERVFAGQITAWDQAAILGLLSLLCGLFVDPEAVSATLDQMVAGTGPAAS